MSRPGKRHSREASHSRATQRRKEHTCPRRAIRRVYLSTHNRGIRRQAFLAGLEYQSMIRLRGTNAVNGGVCRMSGFAAARNPHRTAQP